MSYTSIGLRVGFALTLLFSLPSFAQVHCKDVFAIDYASFETHLKGEVVDKVLSVLGPLKPRVLNVELYPQLEFVKTHLNGDTMFANIGLIEAPLGAIDIALAHEIGHASFLQHFELNISGRKGDALSLLEQINAEFKKIEEDPELRQRVQAAELELTQGQDLGKFQKTILELNDSSGLSEIRRVKAEFQTALEMLIPYNELYADVVAMLYNGRLDAVRQLIEQIPDSPGRMVFENPFFHSDFYPDIPQRDFSTLVHFKKWTPEAHRLSYYHTLDPARGAMGKLYLEQLREADRIKFLQAFLISIQRHYDMRVGRGEILFRQYEAAQLNREFLAILVNAARELGLKPKGRR